MKDGVYLNYHKQKANLVLVENGEICDGGEVSIFDYDLTITEVSMFLLQLTFRKLIYLGKL